MKLYHICRVRDTWRLFKEILSPQGYWRYALVFEDADKARVQDMHAELSDAARDKTTQTY